MSRDYLKMNRKGLELIEKHQYEKALELYLRITRLYPDKFLAWFNCGICAQFTGESEKAEEAFKKAIEIHPEDAPTLNELGLVYFKSHRLDQARKLIEKAAAIHPENAVYRNNLGVLSFSSQDYTSAKADFESAVKLDPAYIDSWFNLRDCCEMLGDAAGQKAANREFERLNHQTEK